jgi:hypothetical protein
MDPRLRAAVDASLCWYDAVFAAHGIATSISEGVWRCHAAPPPLHSAAVLAEPDARGDAVLRAVDPWPTCSVADPFAATDLSAEGMDLLFEASWLHRPPTGAPQRTDRWRVVRTADELSAWNARHDTAEVLLPALLDRSGFCFLARDDLDDPSGGAALLLGTGVVLLNNVFAATGSAPVDWADLIAAVEAVFPRRAVVGYEHGEDLEDALAAGCAAVGIHRVWARTG